MANPFDYINSISTNKKNMMRESENDALAEKEYSAWMVNKGLSYFQDTVLHANLMNINHHLDKRPQYEFLLNSIRRNKRYAKWVKNENSSDLECVMQYFGYSNSKANDVMGLLTKEQLASIRNSFNTGGK